MLVVALGLGVAVYLVAANALRSSVDADLERAAVGGRGAAAGDGRSLVGAPERLCAPATPTATTGFQTTVGLVQVVRADGSTCVADARDAVEPTQAETAAASGGERTRPRDAITAAGVHVRVVAVPATTGYAVLVGRDLTGVDRVLGQVTGALAVAAVAGALLAALAGRAVARAALRPVDQLSAAAERIAGTLDLTTPIEVQGEDEIARLARSFNAMIAALGAARAQQQQLVADAGHELRTPLTSLRTNLELLARSEATGVALPTAERAALLASVVAQAGELGDLARELTTLSQDSGSVAPVLVRLDEVVAAAVRRARRRGQHRWATDLAPWQLEGDPGGLERAVVNLLDNAVKFAPVGSEIQVTLRDGVLTVADHGPGIAPDELDRVFDRFWRSPAARSKPGSGLGLAIVADVVAAHRGRVWFDPVADHGATVHLALPGRTVSGLPGAAAG